MSTSPTNLLSHRHRLCFDISHLISLTFHPATVAAVFRSKPNEPAGTAVSAAILSSYHLQAFCRRIQLVVAPHCFFPGGPIGAFAEPAEMQIDSRSIQCP